jgi:carboxypeptidase C (cathepsin A)
LLHPGLKVIVCNGYYDLATPFLAAEYTFDHIPLPEKLSADIKMTYYEAGHMMYLHKKSLEKLSGDLKDFIRNSIEISA